MTKGIFSLVVMSKRSSFTPRCSQRLGLFFRLFGYITIACFGHLQGQLAVERLERNGGTEIVLAFNDSEEGIATDYSVEVTADLQDEDWDELESSVVSTGPRTWRITATLPQSEDKAFFRVTKNGVPLTASLQSDLTELSEGDANPGITVQFTRAFTGVLTYEIDRLDGTEPQTGSVTVGGASVAFVPVSLGSDDTEATPNGRLTVNLTTSGDYGLGGLSSVTLSLIDNDSSWDGILEEGSSGPAFEFLLKEQGGTLTAKFVGKGTNVFPPGTHPVSSVTFAPGESFSATVGPLVVPASKSPLGEDVSLTIVMTATDSADPEADAVVLDDLIVGRYSMTREVANKAFLNQTGSGTFRMFRRVILTAE